MIIWYKRQANRMSFHTVIHPIWGSIYASHINTWRIIPASANNMMNAQKVKNDIMICVKRFKAHRQTWWHAAWSWNGDGGAQKVCYEHFGVDTDDASFPTSCWNNGSQAVIQQQRGNCNNMWCWHEWYQSYFSTFLQIDFQIKKHAGWEVAQETWMRVWESDGNLEQMFQWEDVIWWWL